MLGGSHTGENPWSVAGMQEGLLREVRCSSLGESLSHHSRTEGLYDQRQFMVLELYCRQAGRKREGRKRESGHGHVEKRGMGGRGGLEMRVREVRA